MNLKRIFPVLLLCMPTIFIHAQTKEAPVTHHAKGTFEVKITPLALEDKSAPATLGRMGIDKVIHGDLEATGKGEMLTAKTATQGSMAYNAIELVTGTLNGKKGSFVLQHKGVMNRGVLELVITVVPDSGTEELAGISGTFTINIADGKHSYDFAYTLAEK